MSYIRVNQRALSWCHLYISLMTESGHFFLDQYKRLITRRKGRAQKLAIYALLQKCIFSLFASLGIFL